MYCIVGNLYCEIYIFGVKEEPEGAQYMSNPRPLNWKQQ